MTPRDQNIITALNLLVLIRNSKKKTIKQNSREEDDFILRITHEHVESTGLKLPVFLNTLQFLESKGYLVKVGIFEKEFHERLRDTLKKETLDKVLSELSSSGHSELTEEQKRSIADEVQAIAPPGSPSYRNKFVPEKVTYNQMFEDVRQLLGDHKDTDVALILLMPFKDIERLLKKMNSGESFDEIQDSEVWYDSKEFKFHIGEKIIPTSYQGKANIEHYILEKITEKIDTGSIWYSDITEYEPRQLRDALNKFVDKDSRLKEIFNVGQDSLKFDKEAFK